MAANRRLTAYRRGGQSMAPRTAQERQTIGIVGAVGAVAGFFVLSVLLGPLAMVCGWVAMRGRWRDGQPLPALIALSLGAIDTLLGLLWLAGSTPGGGVW
ncbi:small hydrophobic protein [Streptomyces sp. NPDC051940]|uniref:small hydrophobic protein n=1 Tax=Streptomyces sp. NPDC051940 TaxID=3155675 RepID=UPI00343A77EE